ncbi:hypothetical protein G7076_04350 [Sphingomonas sp. HDW15A]|uniref:hypothetical protein n=1 Tax=Sphingomonas sp. HDW15A TaxID=2714942 RepID=UPI001409C753|nr:hypothetical protein [Sphingomonas sp. HDW15A]QIK95797.1 hypothetical protein G7076_04350 [Sphingomonas sp. HDW15A]
MATEKLPSLQVSIPAGWRNLYDQLIKDLAGLEDGLAVAQAEQKFAELRVYLARSTPEAKRLIDIAAMASRSTCEECGALARRRTNRQGYSRALCDQHWED